MIAPRKWVHLLLILSELMLIAAHIILVVMYSKYKKPSWNEKIWMGSKIKTIEKIMNENNNKIYPILEVNDNSNISYNKNYQYLLEHSSRSTCSGNYKKCGILDSMGNIMCIPNEDTCPINNLIIDSRDNQTNNLLSSKFKVSQPPLLRLNNEALYYLINIIYIKFKFNLFHNIINILDNLKETLPKQPLNKYDFHGHVFQLVNDFDKM
jgi:hypothetical protein